MTSWLHSTIVATSVAACAAVGFASASIYSDVAAQTTAKTDRLPLVAATDIDYRTVETRLDGVSVLTRVPVAH